MNFFLLFVFLSWISVMPHLSAAQEWDRELYFPDYYFYAERRLVNHAIKTLRVKSLDDCEYLCYKEDACVSLNIKNKDPDGTHECELNNSTHMEDDGDLVNSPIYYYRGAKNNCVKHGRPLCQNNATCQSGFTYKKYRCSCTPGFTGEHCEHDIDECAKATPVCDVNAVCNNTHGAYNCSCKPGYSGDGHNCTDVDECKASNRACDVNANCKNTPGSYLCSCANGLIGDGKTCYHAACQNYQNLSDAERNEMSETKNSQCDNNLNRWYRFTGAAGTKMATTCPPLNRCGASFPGWMDGDHPKVAGVKKENKVHFRTSRTNCKGGTVAIQVTKCDSYYVYQLSTTGGCDRRYCGTY